MTDEQLDRERRLAYLQGVVAVLIDELNQIYRPGRFILWRMLENGRGKRLLFKADAIMAEICRLQGEPHTPLPPIRSDRLIGHPLTWWYIQMAVGVWNACSLVGYLTTERWGFAACSLVCLIVCSLWRIPPYHIAKQGKWHE